jgi:hypothetical protein
MESIELKDDSDETELTESRLERSVDGFGLSIACSVGLERLGVLTLVTGLGVEFCTGFIGTLTACWGVLSQAGLA